MPISWLLWGTDPLLSLDGMSSLCISKGCLGLCLTRSLNPRSRLPDSDGFPANFMGPGKPASLSGFFVFYDPVSGCLFTDVGIRGKSWRCERTLDCQPVKKVFRHQECACEFVSLPFWIHICWELASPELWYIGAVGHCVGGLPGCRK